EVPYRLFIEDADTLNVLPTLALGLLVARGWQQRALVDRGLALVALSIATVFSSQLMFGFFGVLLPLAMLLTAPRLPRATTT
ncbi:TraX family protein, partial [Klebsiella pneumoniae]|uniref:TraX family protein n=1 Tax=Klebsiella pneumoniae TaxID=573 RepID=UPI0039C1CB2A